MNNPSGKVGKDDHFLITLGPEEYHRVLLVQRHLNELCNEGSIGNTLLFLQHPDTYTMGIHRDPAEILGDDIHPIMVERGGSATYHGPGQIVVYFVVNLKDLGINIRDLIVRVERAISKVLREYGIESEGRLHGETGVWVKNKKICSVGFAIKGLATLHGIALNVSTDLGKFGAIMPCGMNASIMTSIENETGSSADLKEVEAKLKSGILSELNINKYLEIDSLKKLGEFSVGNGLRLLPEELLKIIV